MINAWALLDLLTRLWWRIWSKPVDLGGSDAWLQAPMHVRGPVGDDWIDAEADRIGGTTDDDPAAGLMSAMALLDSSGFDHTLLHPSIKDFYEHTASWRMEVWAGWNPLAQPAGALIARFFGRRVKQLAIPVDPISVAHGMDSRVVRILDEHGHQAAAAWIRQLRSSGELVYSGHYAITRLPSTGAPAVHVSFPLESGNVQVLLRPENGPDGSLRLLSDREPHGGLGTYVVVRLRGRTYAAHPRLTETFRLFVDNDGVLRTDHELRYFGIRVVRLHYRLERR